MFGIKNSTTFFAYCNVVAVGYDKICSEPNGTHCTRTLNTELGVFGTVCFLFVVRENYVANKNRHMFVAS